MPVAPSQVASVSRNGQDLVVNLKNGEHVKVANFFNTSPDGAVSDMVFQSEDGTLWQAQYSAQSFNGFTFDEISSIDELIAGTGLVSGATSAWAIAGLGLLGGGGVAAASGSGGGGGGSGGNSAADTTAPDAPTGLGLSANGQTLSGLGEAGAQVTIRDAAGNVLGTGTVGSDGHFAIPLNSAQTNGQTVGVTLTDAAGNTSAPGTTTAGDTVAPGTPGNLTLSTDGQTLSGTGEAGSTVTVRDSAGNLLGSAIVGADGGFQVALSSAQTNGQSLGVTLTDAAGNVSSPGSLTAADTTAPDAPANLQVNANGTALSGRGEAGATIQVHGADGTLLGSGVVAANGTFNLALNPAQNDGQTLSVNAIDAAGNHSANAQTQAPDITAPGDGNGNGDGDGNGNGGSDATPPALPTNVAISTSGTLVSGQGEAGSKVTVIDAGGALLGTTTVAANGTFSVTLNPPQTNGQVLQVTLTDAAGNASSNFAVTAKDTTAPVAPSNLLLSADGLTLTGKAEAGARILVRSASGRTLGFDRAGIDGSFSITLNEAQKDGQSLDVNATDAAGNSSTPVVLTVKDSTPPALVSDVVISADGTQISGKGEPGATVTIASAGGAALGQTLVAANGTFQVSLSSVVTPGDKLEITQTDAQGNPSPVAEVTAPDADGPATPGKLALSADGTHLTGSATPGTTVEVRDASGAVIGSAIVAQDGSFDVTLNPAQVSGQVLDVVAVDGSGESSVTVPLPTTDATAPVAASELNVSNNGLTLSGRGEAGATVSVTDGQGHVLGTAVVSSTGSFAVSLSAAQTSGQALSVVLTDAAGNHSASAPVQAPDPGGTLQPDTLSVGSNGNVLNGVGKVGSRITVTDANGKLLGSAIVGADGHFSVALSSAQNNGQTLLIHSVDSAGNAAPVVTFAADDTQAPAPLTALALDPSGLVLSGKGEAGASIAVLGPTGNSLGSGTVGSDGSFSLTLNTAQTDAQVLHVTQTDGAGNVSSPATVSAPDLSVPDSVTAVNVSANGLVVSGNGQVGATVTVTDAQGQALGTAVVGSNGRFEVNLTSAQTNGQLLSVSQADGSTGVSAAVPAHAPDIQAPAAPADLKLDATGAMLTGTGEPGATVTAYAANGDSLGDTTVDPSGNFQINLTTPQTDGQTLQVSQSDSVGHPSPSSPVTAPDTTAPPALSNVGISGNGATVSGNGQVGDTVTVQDANGKTLGSAVVDGNGHFSVTLNPAQLDGQLLSVTQADASHLPSPVSSVTAPDLAAPLAPTGISVDDAGLVVSGSAHAGDTVNVLDANGQLLGTTVVNLDGTFTVTLDTALTNGQTLQVVATNGVNSSLPVQTTAPDDTAPDPVQNLAINPAGTSLSGTGEPGSTVTVSTSTGTPLGSGTVGNDGVFVIALNPPAVTGNTLEVVSIDAGGNASTAVALPGPDGTQLASPSNLLLSGDGFTLTGAGTPGSTVTVTDNAGASLGSGLVNSLGRFSIRMNFAQLNAQTLHVTASDASGHSSVPGTVIASDSTAPDAPTALTVNANGSVVSGKGEAGATVTISNSNGTLLGTAVVGSSGSFSVTLNAQQHDAQVLIATQRDAAGNVSQAGNISAPDLQAPGAATGLSINNVGTVVSGQGEVGAAVTVRDAAGTVLATGTVDQSGHFQITLPSAQTNGAALHISLTDRSGNISPDASLTTKDSTPPAAVQNTRISADGTVLSGTGEAGATVKVTNAGGILLGSAVVGGDGAFNVTLVPAPVNGQTLDISQTDPSGNVSPSASLGAPDTSPPAALTQVSVNADGITVVGHGEPGATVSVRSVDGTLLGTGLVQGNGAFSLSMSTPQINAQLLTVTQEDPPGNVSTAVNVVSVDLTPPDAPVVVSLNVAGLQLSGSAEAGSSITVRDAAGNVLGTGTTAANGTFTVTLNSAQLNGQNINVSAADAAGNQSAVTAYHAGDSTPPAAVSNLAITTDGSTLAGSGEAGATVVVRDAGGNALGNTVVAANGSFSLTLVPAVTAGTSLSVIQTDTGGNASPGASVIAPGPLAEAAPVNLLLSADGLTLTGTATVGSTVTIRSASGVLLGSALVGSGGTFSATLNAAQLNGEQLAATATSSDGINSVATGYIAADVTAPAPLSNLVLASDGVSLTGRGEAGATVNVVGSGGVALGSTVVAANGTFSLALNSAQVAGQTLTLTQTDASQNESASVNLLARDLIAPDAPGILGVSGNGNVLSGTGEAGATVKVYNAAGALVGTGSVRIDGSFDVTLSTPQANGQVLAITLTDAAGNTSTASPFTSIDTTAPTALTQLAISSDGKTVSGHGEAGANVTVSDSLGVVLGTVTVGTTGTFTLVLPNALTNAQVLTLAQADAAGNVSPLSSLTAPDTSAPDPLDNVAINRAGVLVTGTGEAGATVTVKDASGVLLGSAIVQPNGSFSVTLSTPQINHQTLTVQQADPPGNISAGVTVTAFDLTPPQVAGNLKLNAAGDTLSGSGEAGATISVTLANGQVVGSGAVGANGTFLISLDQPQHNGEQLYVVLADAAGNASAAGTLIAPDTTAPLAVTGLGLDLAGRILSGTGEAGAHLVISNAAGAALGTGTVAANGTFSVTLNAPQLNGEVLSVVQSDVVGNPSVAATVTAADLTAPGLPVVSALSADGLALTGTGEVGALVRVSSATGASLGTATVDASGHFNVTLSAAQLNGQTLSVSQTDAATNRSALLSYQVADVTDPAAVTQLAVSPNGLTLTGNGEAGATVSVSNNLGTVLGTATVAANGSFSVGLSSAQLNGQTLSVVQLDAAKNDSTPVSVNAPDSTAPLLPTVTSLTGGTLITGTAEAGSTVTVTSASGTLLGSAQADINGAFSFNLNTPQTNGQLLSVVATDPAKNPSPVRVFLAPDTTAPDAVTGLTINAAHNQVVGRGEVGASVVVSNALGATLGSGTVAADGTFTINLNATVPSSQVLTVVQTDAGTNASTGVNLTVPSVQPPDAPAHLTLSANGQTLGGTAAIGTTINVYGSGGTLLGTALTGGDGTFSVSLSGPQLNGQSLQVTATAATGEISLPGAIVAADTTAPAVLSDLAVNATGTLVTGRGEVGATVTINAPGGAVLGTAIVGANGTFSALLGTPQLNGQLLSAHQNDPAGNPSPALDVKAPDITAPAAPSALGLNPAGLILSGLGEAGATVTVRSAAGVLGSTTVAADGTFAVTLNAAQLNGQALSVAQTDVAGNLSANVNLNAADTTPPAALSNLALTGGGLLVSGSGEAGATVKITNAAGTVLGSVVVNAAGTFAATLNAAQLNGQTLNIQQADPAGNLSPIAHLTATDIQAPSVPTTLALAANGQTLTGAGEVGATVNVYDASNTLLGTTQVGLGATFNLTLSPPQLDGQALTVRLVDATGNVSAAASLTAPDSTAPVAPATALVNATGTLVTGTGVAGSAVSVRSAAGVVLATGTVAANGTFSITLPTALINNEVLSVTQADPAGNVSLATSATAPDLTAPVAASTLLVSADGLSLSGTGEAGSTVIVKAASGAELGRAVVGGTGVFSVTLNAAQINGEKLSVSLTDTHGNVSLGASVTAPDIDANAPVSASDNLAIATVNIAPAHAVQNIADSFTTLLSGFSKTYSFSVASGTHVDPTLTLNTASLLSLIDGVVYALQVKDASGNWVTLDVNGNGGLLDILGLAGQGVQVTMGDLQSGDYRLIVSSTGIGIVTTVTSVLSLDTISLTQFTGSAGTATTGNVISDVGTDGQVDQTGPDNGAVLQVLKNGSYVSAGAGTTVQGLYGTLNIDSTGKYTYTANGAVSSVGKVDVFSYQLVHPNGLSDSASLYVRIDSPQATEVWNDSSLSSPALLVDATDDIAHSAITLVNKEVTSPLTALGSFGVLLGGGSGTYTTSVASNTVSDLTVVVNASNLLTLLGSLTVGLYKLNASNQYVLVKSYGGASLLSLGGGSYGVNFDDQTAGTYQVRVAVGGVGLLTTVNTSLISATTYNNQFVVGSYTPVSGNLLTDVAGGGVDVLGSPYTLLSVLLAGSYVTPGYNGTTIAGTYGSLLVHADGSYTYTLNAGLSNAVIGHADVFNYQLTHPNGTTDTASLTIDLDQAAAKASASFAALSTVDDHSAALAVAQVTSTELVQGTDGNDTLLGTHGGAVTLNGGAGNDTLIIADQNFASVDGGSGTDTLLWAGGDAAINLGDLQSRIHNIEILDLNHTSAVSLTLNLADVLSITSPENSTLLIKGDSKDSVHMTDVWTADGSHQAGGIDYTQYTPQEDPSHHLWVQNGVQVV